MFIPLHLLHLVHLLHLFHSPETSSFSQHSTRLHPIFNVCPTRRPSFVVRLILNNMPHDPHTSSNHPATLSPSHRPTKLTLNILLFLLVVLALVPETNAMWGYAGCRQQCNMAFLSCMSVYGEYCLFLPKLLFALSHCSPRKVRQICVLRSRGTLMSAASYRSTFVLRVV